MNHHPPILALAFALSLTACGEPPTEKPTPYRPPDPWSNKQEVLYQTREVIYYLDEQRELERRRLDSLGVLPQEAAGDQGQPQAEQHEAHGDPIAPAHEGG